MSRRTDIQPDPRTSIGMLAAMIERHPDAPWDEGARIAAALHRQELIDAALRYAFSGEPIPRDDAAPREQ